MKNNKQYQNVKGFTLIEMAIVMIIGGILLSFMGSALLMYVEKSHVRDTEVRMEVIKDALQQYLNVNKRYPCVARRDIAPGEVPASGEKGFGREVDTDCTAGVITGTARAPSTTPEIRIGAVPVRSLNLPDEMAFDGWGRRFTYAVTEDLASGGGPSGTLYTHDGGVISIEDTSGTAFTSEAHYVLISHGRTGDGAFTFNGNQTTPCPDTATLDGENCNDDETFVMTLVNSEADAADFYDDYLLYQGQTEPTRMIPRGAVMAFNRLDGCPTDGWQPFAEAAGKFIIGVGTNIPANTYSFNTTAPTSPIEIDSIRDTNSKDDNTLMPPYVALIYCVKE